jgi:hypothetical protein
VVFSQNKEMNQICFDGDFTSHFERIISDYLWRQDLNHLNKISLLYNQSSVRSEMKLRT